MNDNKYIQRIKKLLPLIGGQNNFDNYYNCMTRLRFSIINENLVEKELLKKIDYIKAIVWRGKELQLIIGGEVYKFKDALDILINRNNKLNESKQKVVEFKIPIKKSNKPNKTLKDKFIKAISGIMIPIIPLLMASGLLMGLKAILIQANLIQNVGGGLTITDLNWYSALNYIISEVGLGFLGIFICMNTVKMMGGSPVMGAFLGVAIASPFLTYTPGFLLFSIGKLDFKIMAYKNQLLPHITAGIIYVLLDNWIKKWMPSTIDIVFRSFIAFTITTILIFLVLGPILTLIENGLDWIVTWVGKTPYGIGAGIFSFLWQPLVLTGMHAAVALKIIASVSPDTPSVLYAMIQIAVLAQTGGALAVAVRAKKPQLVQAAYGSIPAGLFGITEPIIYSVNLPKITPFFFSAIGAGVGGMIAALAGISGLTPGGQGLLGFTRHIAGGPKMVGLFFMGATIAMLTAFALTFIFYKERQTEIKGIKFSNKFLIKYVNKNIKQLSKIEKEELKKELNLILKNITKENLNLIKQFENNLIKYLKLNQNKTTVENKYALLKETLIAKKNKMIEKNRSNKIFIIENKIENINGESKIEIINNKIKISEKLNEELTDSLELFQESLTKFVENTIRLIAKRFNSEELKLIESMYFNAIYSAQINYDIISSKENTLVLKK